MLKSILYSLLLVAVTLFVTAIVVAGILVFLIID